MRHLLHGHLIGRHHSSAEGRTCWGDSSCIQNMLCVPGTMLNAEPRDEALRGHWGEEDSKHVTRCFGGHHQAVVAAAQDLRQGKAA